MTADDETPARNRTTRRRTEPQPAAKPPGRPRLGGMRERLQDVNILLDVTRRISETELARRNLGSASRNDLTGAQL